METLIKTLEGMMAHVSQISPTAFVVLVYLLVIALLIWVVAKLIKAYRRRDCNCHRRRRKKRKKKK